MAKEELSDIVYVVHGDANPFSTGSGITVLNKDDKRVSDLGLYYNKIGYLRPRKDCLIDIFRRKEKQGESENQRGAQTKKTDTEKEDCKAKAQETDYSYY